MLACLTELRYVPYQNFHNAISLFRVERNKIADYQFAGSGNEARNTEVTYRILLIPAIRLSCSYSLLG